MMCLYQLYKIFFKQIIYQSMIFLILICKTEYNQDQINQVSKQTKLEFKIIKGINRTSLSSINQSISMSQQKPTNRRAVLWNVQIPGDPYDIRKSMIARLPEHPARFMGDNLELVCLFQAAQIQRLAQYLDEMTLEMRSLERVELDRHSYEVQIKELAQKLQLYNQSKQDNNKLREFIKGQSEELHTLQRYRNSAQSLIELQTKYESVLNELRHSRDNYEALRKTNSDSLNQLADLKYRYERLQQSLAQERASKERQIKFSVQRSISETRQTYELREHQLKGDLTVMKENLMLKNQEIYLEKEKNAQSLRQLAEKDDLIGRYMRGEIEIQSGSKTQEFLKISKRLEESTYLLEQKEKSIINYKDEITYLSKRIKQLQDDIKKRQQDLRRKEEQLRKRDSELKNRSLEYNNSPELLKKIAEFDQKIIILSSEIERLKEVILHREKQIKEREKQITFYKEKSSTYEKNIEAMQKQLHDRESLIKKMEFQVQMGDSRDAKIQALGGEVTRLNMILREKVNEIARLESRQNESTQTESHHLTLIRTKEQAIRVLESRSKEYETKLNHSQQANKLNVDQINRITLKLTTCENANIQLRRQIDSKTHSTSTENAQFKNQINTLTQEINDKLVENKKLRQDNQKMFAELNQMERKILNHQTTINQLRNTNAQKLTDIQQIQISFKENQRSYVEKIQMYSKSVPKMSQEIERLHQLLEKRNTDLKRVQQDLEMERQRALMNERRNSTQVQIKMLEYERSMAFYESKCKNYEKLNSQLNDEKHKVNDRIASLQNKLRESHSQLDKIMSALKAKELSSEEYGKRQSFLQATINQLREENLKLQGDTLKSRQQLELNLEIIKKLTYELDLHRRDLNASITSYNTLKQEHSKLRNIYEEKELSQPGLRHTIDELKHKLAKAENQINHLNHELNERKKRAQAQEEQLRQNKAKLSQYQDSIKHTEQVNAAKIEQLRQKLLQEFDIHLKLELSRYKQLQQAYSELEMNYQNKSVYFEDQSGKVESLEGRVQDLQKQDSELRHHLEQYQQKVFSYEQKFALISQQIERLTIENNSYKTQNRTLTQQIDKQKQQLASLRAKIQQLTRQQYSDQSDARAIAQLNQQLSRTNNQLANVKQMLQEYESINQHAIAERDELFAITHQQEDKIAQYQLELNKTKNQLALKERQLTGLKGSSSELYLVKEQYTVIHNQYGVLQQEYNRLVAQLQSAKRKISELSTSSVTQRDLQIKQMQIKIHKITQHYENALRIQHHNIKEYEKKVYDYEQRAKGYEQQIQGYQQSIEKHLRSINLLQMQNAQLKSQIADMEKKLSTQTDIDEQVEQLKTAYINIKMQNEELNRMLEEMQEQLFEANEANNKLNLQLNQIISRLNNYAGQDALLAQLHADNAHLNRTIDQQRTAIQTLRQKLSLLATQMDQIRSQTELKIQSLNSQHASLTSSYISLQQQNSTLRQQVQSLQLQLNQASVYQQISQDLEAKYNELYATYQKTYTVYNEMMGEAETLKGSLESAENRISLLNDEFDKLGVLLVQLRNELHEVREDNSSLRQQLNLKEAQIARVLNANADLEAELKRVYQLNDDLDNQLKQTRLRLTDQHALEQKIKHHMFLFVMMCAEVESLRKRVVQTQQQCEQVRRNSISPIKPKK